MSCEDFSTLHLQKQYFEAIASGRKTIEARLFDEKRQKLVQSQPNDCGELVIRFICDETGESFDRVLKGCEKYSSFSAAAKEHFREMIPWVETPEEVVSVYLEIYGNDLESKYGVVLLRV